MFFQDLINQTKGKKVHFIGIGGIGMSALALVLRQKNIAVQGSDLTENYLTEKLRAQQVEYFTGHSKENITNDIALVVKTSIIKEDNPEIIAAKAKNITIITRANLLAMIMQEKFGITIAGTHGKTSTTAMISIILEIAGLDPTFINGGVINYFSSNQKIGNSNFLVAESDESDGSFIDLPTKIGVITNIEPEHLDFKGYNGDFAIQKQYFQKYIDNIPEQGMCALGIDNQEVFNIYQNHQDKNQDKNKVVSYAIENNTNFANITASNIKINRSGTSFSVDFKDGRHIPQITMPIYGKHNVCNALASIAVADFLKIPFAKIIEALEKFDGVKRRFSKVGEYQGIVIIDDYGHHPTEIKATLSAAKKITANKIVCVFEPHKHTRVRDLFQEFCNAFIDADIVIVSEIYSAGQSPIEGFSQDSLIEGIEKTKHCQVIKMSDPNSLAKIIKPLINQKLINEGDIIFCTGAGKITYWASNLQKQLEEA